MRKTKGFSCDPEKDKDLMEHIRRKGGSQYVWDLVRKDMNENNIEELVKRQIEKYLQGCEFRAGKGKEAIEIDANEINNILSL